MSTGKKKSSSLLGIRDTHCNMPDIFFDYLLTSTSLNQPTKKLMSKFVYILSGQTMQ